MVPLFELMIWALNWMVTLEAVRFQVGLKTDHTPILPCGNQTWQWKVAI
jgi:hypothetical protein